MEIVLGVSMTPTTVRMALVEGEKADGVVLEHDVFDITAIDGSATSSASEHVIAAILGTQEGAIENGHHLVSTGVTWSDHAEAAVLREALEARGIEDVMLVSELHAAAALAQAVGRAVGFDKTALMFVERDTATLAVVETADGSVVKVLSQSLHSADAFAVPTEMVTSLEGEKSLPHGMFVVGSSVDVASVKSHLQGLVSMAVIAPEEPELALARGAALASASAPRFDASTVGLAYSQDPDGITALLGYDGAFLDTADIGATNGDVQEGRKPFALVGSSLTAVFAVGMTALAITMGVNIQPTFERATGASTVRPSAVAPPAVQSATPPTPQPAPKTVPEPAPAAPAPAAAATARLMVPPAPPPRVVVRNAAPAPVAPPPLPPVVAPPPPPPVAPAPVVPAPIIQWPAPWLPPILQPPPYYYPRVQSPPWYPAPWGPYGPGGHRGRHGD
jgi:hypothetical protein